MRLDIAGGKLDPMGGFARSFTLAYSMCYLASPFMGLHVENHSQLFSALILISIGAGLFYSAHNRNRYVLGLLAVGEAMACVAHYLRIIPWTPAFSDNAYIIMAILDLVQSMCLFKMME